MVVPIIKTNPAPVWSNFQSWRAGTTVGLDGSASISLEDSTSTPALTWQILSGPSKPIWSSHTAVKPTLTGIVFGNYRVQLVATNSSGVSATAVQDIGAVAYDDNGVVMPADPRVTEIFGPQIAFGQNPWGREDERNLKAILLQTAYQAANYDTTWYTTGQGTVSYPFAGKGFAPGSACTTLTSGITATATSIAVANASCLSLSGLPAEPTWILVGTGLGAYELIRICSASATSGAATLTVCYDGRGVSGNATGNFSPGGAQAWNSGAVVGEFRIQGTGTLFATDPARAICPAGVPGPPGLVRYSTGTVTLTAGSTTVTGSGTSWTGDNGVRVGDYIRVPATHGGGTSFIFWGQVVTVTDPTHLVLNRPAPTGVDGSAFNYKVTSVGDGSPTDPTGMYLVLEFTAPDSHVARLIFNSFGCESETAMFSTATRDIPVLDSTVMSGVKYTYKKFLGAYSAFGPFFYGMGIAARNFYYRSGYGPALTLANAIDEYGVRDPELGDGFVGGSPLFYGASVIGGIIDLVLNPSTALTWANVEQNARSTVSIFGSYPACNSTDTRDGGYMAAFLTLEANYDPNSTNRAAFKNFLSTLLTRDQGCKRNAADGYTGGEVNSFANSFDWGPQGPLTLTNGSASVTGSGLSSGLCAGVDIGTITVNKGSSTATVASGTLTQQNKVYIWDSTGSYLGVFAYSVSGSAVQLAGVWPGASGTFSFMNENTETFSSIWTANTDDLAHNQALEKNWACKYNSPSSLTLNRAWDAASGSAYYISTFTGAVFFQQPFMLGVKTNQMNWASKNDDAMISSGYKTILPLVGEWYNSYGYDSVNTQGSFYLTVQQACSPPTVVAAGSFYSIHGEGCGDSGVLGKPFERVNSIEGGSAMIQYYLGTPTPARGATVDRFYGAIFGDLYCAASVSSTCDGILTSNMTDGDLGSYKWPGFFFGMGGFFANSWPAVRQGGAAPPMPRTLNVTCNISSVANATKCRVTLTKPDGSSVTNTCTTSPCPVTADGREGDHLLEVDYLSASNEVLSAGEPVPVRVN